MNAPSHSPPGSLISVDGIDGVGKSTQIERLGAHLEFKGRKILVIQDPGSTEIGAQLRAILLDSNIQLHRRTEAMLFMASRCEMVETVIRPALEAGQTVLSDRFLLANVVYQSVGGGVDVDTLWQLGELANAGLRPDLTILLDMPAAAAASRLNRPADRLEARGEDYLESVRQAFLQQLPKASPRTHVVRADRPIDEVAGELSQVIDRFFDSRPDGPLT